MARDSVLEALGKGIAASTEWRPASTNPYPEGTKLAEVWTKGWEKAATLRNVYQRSRSMS